MLRTLSCLLLCFISLGLGSIPAHAGGVLYQFDADGDGANTIGDREVILWWIFAGGNLQALSGSLEPGANGLYDLSGFFGSQDAQISPRQASSPFTTMQFMGSALPEVFPGCEFIRGDANSDGMVNIADVTYLNNYLFASGSPLDHLDAGDVNDDGALNIGDSITLLNYLFQQTAPPATPFPEAGRDPTPDGLDPNCDPVELGDRLGFLEMLCGDDTTGGTSGYCWLKQSPQPRAEETIGTASGGGGSGGAGGGGTNGGVSYGPVNPWPLYPPGGDADGDGIVDEPTRIVPYRASSELFYVLPAQFSSLSPEWSGGSTNWFGTGSSVPPERAFRAAGRDFLNQGEDPCFGYQCPEVAVASDRAYGIFNFPGSPRDFASGGREFDENFQLQEAARVGSMDRCGVTGFSKYSYKDKDTGLVDVATGEIRFSQSYLHLKGRGLDYEFSFKYCSRPRGFGISSALGLNVDHYYFQRIVPWFGCNASGSSGFVRIVDGQAEFYAQEDGDLYLQAGEGYNRLRVVRDTSGDAETIVVRTPSGLMFSYFAPLDAPFATAEERALTGRLQKIIDPHGNQITLYYDSVTYALDKVVDTLGREIQYSYDANGMLSSVNAPDGRVVEFEYSAPDYDTPGHPNNGSWPAGSAAAAHPTPPVGEGPLLAMVRGPAVSRVASSGTDLVAALGGAVAGSADGHGGQELRFNYNAHFVVDGVTTFATSFDGFQDISASQGVGVVVPLLTMVSVDSDTLSSPDPYIKLRYGPSGRVAQAVYGGVTSWQAAETELENQGCGQGGGGGGGGSSATLDLIRQMSGSQTTFIYEEFPYHGPCLDTNAGPRQYMNGKPPTVQVHIASAGGGVETVSFDDAGAVQEIVQHEGVIFGGLGNLDNFQATSLTTQGSWASLFGSEIPCHNYCKYVTTILRNEKGQPTLTIYPNGNARAVRYDPIVGGVLEERVYEGVNGTTYNIQSELHSHEVGITRYELSGNHFVASKQIYEPLFGNVIQEWDARHTSLVDDQVAWPDYSYSSMDFSTLVTRHFVDYEGLTLSGSPLEFLWLEFGLPDVTVDSPFPPGAFPQYLTAAPHGQVVATKYPTATLPELQSNSGEAWAIREYTASGLLDWEANAEGVVTAYEYFDASDSHSPGPNYNQAVGDPYPPIFGHVGVWGDARGGFVKSVIEDASAPVIDRGSVREVPEASAAGRRTDYLYDEYGNEREVTDPLGRVTVTKYNELNLPIQAIDALGFVTYWYYDALNKMVLELREYGATDFSGNKLSAGPEVIVPDEHQGTGQEERLVPKFLATAYRYDPAGNLAAKSETYTDENGDITVNSKANALTNLYFYNLDHKLIQSVSPRGRVDNHFYYDRGEKWFDAIGTVEPGPAMKAPEYLGGANFPFSALGDGTNIGDYPLPIELNVASSEHDSWNPAPTTRFRAYGYDYNGNLSCEVDAAQAAPPSDPNPIGADVTAHYYDRWDRLERTVHHDATIIPNPPSGDYPPGTQEIYFYDPAGNVVRKDTVGEALIANPTSVPATRSAVPLVEDQLLARSQYRYDEWGRKVVTESEIFDLGIAPSGDVAVTETYLDRLGKVVKAVDAEGREAHSRYDRLGRLVRTATPEADDHGGGDEYARAWELVESYHDEGDRVLEVKRTERDRYGQDFASYYTVSQYDDADRAIEVEDHIGQITRMRYDSRGLVVESLDARDQSTVSETRMTEIDQQTQQVVRNDTGNVTRAFYDVFGRATEQRVEMREDGFGDAPLVELNGALGRVHALLSDPGDQIVTHGQSISTRALHDRHGNTIVRIDDNGRETAYDYSQHDQLVLVTHPDSTTDSYTYDEDGLQTSHTDGNGTTVDMYYDIGHRLIQRHVSAAGQDVAWEDSTQAFAYDGLGRVVWSLDANDPSTSSDDHACVRLYDSLGRLRWEYFDGSNGIQSQYDDVGNKKDLAYPSGEHVEAFFDTLNRVSALHKDGAPWVTYQRAGTGRMLQRNVLAADLITAFEFDDLGRMTAIDHTAQGTPIRRFVQSYNRSNHRTCEVRTPGDRVDSWFYDSADRLYLEVEGDQSCPGDPGGATQGVGVVKEYWLDGVGNWIATRETDPNSGEIEHRNAINSRNAYVNLAGTPYDYDDAGNRIDRDGRQYFYDGFRRLVAVSDGNLDVTYEYFADHRRARKAIVGALDRSYIYNEDHIVERHDSSVVSQSFVYGDGLHRVLTLHVHTTGEQFGIVDDVQGSTSALLDASGTLIESYEYGAYGEVTIYDDQDNEVPASLIGNDFLYVGYLHEPEIDHYWLKFRVYDPGAGKFLTIDPIGVWTDGANWGGGYGYAGYNPVDFHDVDGLMNNGGPFLLAKMDMLEAGGSGSGGLVGIGRGRGGYGGKSSGAVGKWFKNVFGGKKKSPVPSRGKPVLTKPVQVKPVQVKPVQVKPTPATPAAAKPTQRPKRLREPAKPQKQASGEAPKGVNGNSKASTNPQHRYEIKEAKSGDVQKTGISGKPLNKNGTSGRANTQVNKLNKAEGKGKYEATVKEKNLPGRQAGLNAEQAATDRLAKEGNSLRLQKRPKPREQK